MSMAVAGIKVNFSGESVDLTAAANESTRAVEKLQTTLAKPLPQTGAEQAMERVGRKSAEVVKLNAQQVAGLQFQLQDMAVGLSSGQSPLTVMLQQGSQIAQSFTSGTGVLGALKAVGGGLASFLTNPLNLAVVGAGLATTAIVGIASAVMANFPSANDQIEKHNDLVKKIGENWDASKQKIKDYGIETRNTMLFSAQMASLDLRKALSGEVGGLAVNAQRYQGRITAGVSEVDLHRHGGGALEDTVKAFWQAVREGRADVMGFREEISKIAIASGDPRVGSLVKKLMENTAAAAELEQSWKQNQDVVKGLTGDSDLLNRALGKGTEKVQGLTSALDKLAATRHDNIFGTTTLTPAPRFTGVGSDTGFAAAPEKYRAMILDAARQYNMDPDFIARQIYQESRFNPNAVSKRGAQGLMQLMPGTAGDLNVAAPFDPRSNIFGGTRYMSQLMEQFANNPQLALMAYNWGQGNVQKWQAGGADPSKVPAETRDYVSSIMGGRGSLSKADAAIDRAAEKEKERAIANDRRWAQVITETTAAVNTRSGALGKSAGEQARLNKETELWAQAQRIYGERIGDDKKLHDELARSIEKTAAAYGKQAEAAEFAAARIKAAETMERQRIEQMDQLRGVTSGMVSTLVQAKEAGQSWGNSLNTVLDSLKQKAVSLLDTLLDSLLMGKQGTSDGGLLGGLGKMLSEAVTYNFLGGDSVYARGAAFAGGVEMFAGGGKFGDGSFTNSVVNRPTMFRFGGKLGVMGEAGPEAIMPLSGGGVAAKAGGAETRLPLARMGNGSLGVSLPEFFARGDVFGSLPRPGGGAGGGASGGLKVNVNTHNYAGEKVNTKVAHTPDGDLDIEVMVGEAVNRHLARGGADEVIGGRYTGLRRKTNVHG